MTFRSITIRSSIGPFHLRVVLSSLFGFVVCLTPGLASDFIEGIHSPFNDVERINASFTVRSELVDALGDPLGAIAATLGADQNMLFQLSGQGIVTH